MELPKEIQELNDLLRPRWVSGLWNVDHAERPSDPKTRVRPHLWKWHDIYDSLLQAKEKISVASGSVERRVIRLVNPGMAESEMTSHTILLSFQLIQPGEVAPAHRHTMSAFRFILQGHGAYTNVDGQKMVMEDGDLILTPQGCWHEHAHEGDENMVWIDGLDVPFVQALQSDFFRPVQRPLARERSYRSSDVLWHDPARWQRDAGNGSAAALPLARHLPIVATTSARIRESVRRRRAGIRQSCNRRPDTADHVMPRAAAAPQRTNQIAPPYQHEHLPRFPRQRDNDHQWRKIPLAKRRHLHRAAVVVARPCERLVDR